MKVLFIVTACSIIPPYLYAVSGLTLSNGDGTVANGALQVCPSTTVSLTCSHDGANGLTLWDVSGPVVCPAVVIHNTNPVTTMCGSFKLSVNMVSAANEQPRTSTFVLPVDLLLNGVVVTCFAGATNSDPQAGNLTIQVIGPPSIPTIDSMEYSVGDEDTGRFTFLANSSGTFGTEVTISASVAGDTGSVVVTDNNIIVTGLSYNGSHTVSVVVASAVCPGVLNNINVPVMFNIRSPVLTRPTGFVDCSTPSLPISGSWSLMEGAQSSNDVAFPLDPPPINTTITYTSARGCSGSAVFVSGSSYQLTDTVENDVYTFTVTVTNAAGPSSEVSAKIEGNIHLIAGDEDFCYH